MATKHKATIEDLYRYDGKAELVDGKIVPIPLNGGWTSHAVVVISASLYEYAKRTKRGEVFGPTAAYQVALARRESFSPDVGFYSGRDTGMKFLDGAPVFAVEIRNTGEYGTNAERQMTTKRRDYFQAGTLVVWDVDLLSEDRVRVYRASEPDKATIYRRGEMAEAEPALPGWSMAVDDLLPEQVGN